MGRHVRAQAEDDRAFVAGGSDYRASLGPQRAPAWAGLPRPRFCCGAEILLRRLLCLVTAAKHGGSFKIASKFEELPADDAISEIPEEMLTEVYTRVKLEEKLESYRNK